MSNTAKSILMLIGILMPRLTAGDLTLELVLQKVVRASYERFDLELQTDEINARRRQLTADYLPSIASSLISTQSEQGPRDVFVGSIPFRQPATSYAYHSASLNLSQPIFDWGNTVRKRKKLQLEAGALKMDYLQKARRVADQAITIYFQLSEATEIHSLLRQELSDARRQQTHLNNLVEQGIKPVEDQLRNKIIINDILSRISSETARIAGLRAKLFFLMNTSEDTAVRLTVPNYENPDLVSGASLPSPEAVYLTRKIRMNETELSILHWDRLPDVTFNAGYSRGNEMFKSLYTNFHQDWNTYFALNVSIPLFNTRQQRLRETRKRIEIQRLSRKLSDEQKDHVQEIARLKDQIRAVQKQFELQKESLKYYESIYAHELERYNTGLIEFQRLKTARSDVLQSRISLIKLKHQWLEKQEKLRLNSGEWDTLFTADEN
ncbi:MAG: TolC family protein [Fidelibacterota bacterium]